MQRGTLKKCQRQSSFEGLVTPPKMVSRAMMMMVKARISSCLDFLFHHGEHFEPSERNEGRQSAMQLAPMGRAAATPSQQEKIAETQRVSSALASTFFSVVSEL